MPTYVYETIPKNSKEKPTRFELRQSIKDTPISEHPDTGQKVRRVISGGISILPKKGSSTQNSSCCQSASGSCCDWIKYNYSYIWLLKETPRYGIMSIPLGKTKNDQVKPGQ